MDADDAILKLCGDIARGQGYPEELSITAIRPHAEVLGLTNESLRESLQLLEEHGYLEGLPEVPNNFDSFHVTYSGFERYAQRHIRGYEAVVMAVKAQVVDSAQADSDAMIASGTIAQTLDEPPMVVAHILERLHFERLVGGSELLPDGGRVVWSPSVALRRQVRQG